MRRYHQQQMLELLKAVESAQSDGLYAECKGAVTTLIHFAERTAADGGRIISMLKDYSELLAKAEKGELKAKHLRKNLINIENAIRFELKANRIEIVFLGYRAYLFDSYETIYKAAKKDPDCDAYFIPIPYYAHEPGGAKGELKYEGQEYYKKEIECIDYRIYDIEARRPDVIFTHNPYDQYNNVTSVHPDYYCERLRGLTDLLVYIPYFVTSKGFYDYFATSAGCVFAHKIIVQSEEIRDEYIRMFKEQYGDQFGKPEDKFIALGSPKFDAAADAANEEYDIPEEWRRLIYNENGEKKKVIFYNFRLTDMSAGADKQLIKLAHVIEFFRNRSDIVMWFRPHPLNEQCLRSMCPQFLPEYQRIIEGYKQAGFGIFDQDAGLLYRAIAMTDAYYGDGSSVVDLCRAAGKPVMIQNIAFVYKYSESNKLFIHNFSVHADRLWFCLYFINALIEVKIPDMTVGLVEPLRCGDYKKNHLYNGVLASEDKLYLVPDAALAIAEYDIKTKAFDTFDIPFKDEIFNNNRLKFGKALRWNDFIVYTPCTTDIILLYNTISRKIDCYECIAVPPNERSNIDDVYGVYKFVYACIGEDVLVIPYRNINAVVIFNLKDKSVKTNPLGDADDKFLRCCYCGGYFWVTALSGRIYKCSKDFNDNKIVHEGYHSGGIPQGFNAWGHVISHLGHIWVFGGNVDTVLRINPVTDEVKTIPELSIGYSYDDSIYFPLYRGNYIFAAALGDKIAAYNVKLRQLLVFDAELKDIARFDITLNENEMSGLVDSVFKSKAGGWLTEGFGVDLKHFVDYVIYNKADVKPSVSTDNAGKKIYDYVKESAS